MKFAYYQTETGNIAQLFTDTNQKTFICDYCGDVIFFSDAGMGNIYPFNLFKPGIHVCNKNPYLKEVTGRKDYTCVNCQKPIARATKHLYRSTIVTGSQRIHIEC